MFSSLALLVTFFSLPLASLASQCLYCNDIVKLNFTQALETPPSGCSETVGTSDLCFAALLVDHQQATADLSLGHFPVDELVFSNGYKTISNVMKILFEKSVAKQTVALYGSNSSSCFEDVKKIFNKTRTLKYEEVRGRLMEKLHTSDRNTLDLTCANNQNQAVKCPYGFCQLIQLSETSFDRRCIEKGSSDNPAGLIVITTLDEKLANGSIIQYACNKPMCNNIETSNQVRDILLSYQLVEKGAAAVVPDNSATKTSQQMLIMNLAWLSLLTMARFFL